MNFDKRRLRLSGWRRIGIILSVLWVMAVASAASASDATRPTLAEQKLCAEQAKKAFDEFQQGDKSVMADYRSHFDPQKNLCYVRIHSLHGVLITDSVYDAFERRTFATYMGPGRLAKPMECYVHPREQPTVDCKSIEEYDDLVEKWFGVAQ